MWLREVYFKTNITMFTMLKPWTIWIQQMVENSEKDGTSMEIKKKHLELDIE